MQCSASGDLFCQERAALQCKMVCSWQQLETGHSTIHTLKWEQSVQINAPCELITFKQSEEESFFTFLFCWYFTPFFSPISILLKSDCRRLASHKESLERDEPHPPTKPSPNPPLVLFSRVTGTVVDGCVTMTAQYSLSRKCEKLITSIYTPSHSVQILYAESLTSTLSLASCWASLRCLDLSPQVSLLEDN